MDNLPAERALPLPVFLVLSNYLWGNLEWNHSHMYQVGVLGPPLAGRRLCYTVPSLLACVAPCKPPLCVALL